MREGLLKLAGVSAAIVGIAFALGREGKSVRGAESFEAEGDECPNCGVVMGEDYQAVDCCGTTVCDKCVAWAFSVEGGKWDDLVIHGIQPSSEEKKAWDKLQSDGDVFCHKCLEKIIPNAYESHWAESFEAEKKNCGCGQDPCVTYGAESFSAETFEADSLKGRWKDGTTRNIHGVSVTKTPMSERYKNEKPEYRASYNGENARIYYEGVARYLPCWMYHSYGGIGRQGCFKNPMDAILDFKSKAEWVKNAESFSAESNQIECKEFREAVSEIAWGDMTDREPFDDSETLDQIHRYSQQAYGFEELKDVLQQHISLDDSCACMEGSNESCFSCEVRDILSNPDYEAEGHQMMADNFMPYTAMWNEADEEADKDAMEHFDQNSIKDEGVGIYMAEASRGKSRFMKPNEVIDLFKQADGTLVSVTFVKRTNGEVRKMLCRTSVKKGVKGVGLKFNPKNKNLIGVYDFQKVREGADPWKCYRFVPIDAVLSMRVRGKTYTA